MNGYIENLEKRKWLISDSKEKFTYMLRNGISIMIELIITLYYIGYMMHEHQFYLQNLCILFSPYLQQSSYIYVCLNIRHVRERLIDLSPRQIASPVHSSHPAKANPTFSI